ncbi:hypothetical protein BH10CYA1_BH10CYA1_05070 [soil metagenome]
MRGAIWLQLLVAVWLVCACGSALADDLAGRIAVPDRVAPAEVGWKVDPAASASYTAGGGIKGFTTTAANLKSTISNLIFEIPVRAVEPHADRLVGSKVTTETLSLRSDNKGPFKDYSEFQALGLAKIPTKVRSYGVKGLSDVRIVLPEAYAVRLDEGKLMQKDPGTGQMSPRVAPADLPQLIDQMPDPRYFKRIFISDKSNPEDDWVTQTYFSKGFVSATAMIEGELFLYKTNLTDYLRRDLMHEWGHELRYKYWKDPVKDLFHDAVQVETQWNPRQYAARGDSEQWAVLGEKLLGTSANDFIEACERAPIRTTLWMSTLKKCLANVPKRLWTEDQKKYAGRADYVARQVRGKALDSVRAMRTSETDPAKVVVFDRLAEKL